MFKTLYPCRVVRENSADQVTVLTSVTQNVAVKTKRSHTFVASSATEGLSPSVISCQALGEGPPLALDAIQIAIQTNSHLVSSDREMGFLVLRQRRDLIFGQACFIGNSKYLKLVIFSFLTIKLFYFVEVQSSFNNYAFFLFKINYNTIVLGYTADLSAFTP